MSINEEREDSVKVIEKTIQYLTVEDANRCMAKIIEIVQYHVSCPEELQAIIKELYHLNDG